MTREIEIYFGLDTMTLAGKVAAAFLRHKAVVVMVDGGGVGGGVVDRLRQLRIPVIEVDFGSGPDNFANDGVKYANKRSEEHTSELQSLMLISYAVFCLKKKKHTNQRKY